MMPTHLQKLGDITNTLYLACDVSSEADVMNALQKTMGKFGLVDLLVNNAAIMPFKPIEEMEFDEWKRTMDVNLGSIFLFAKYFKNVLTESGGSIVNIASTRALMSEPNTEAYSASKGGVVALTHALALSLSPNVRVNCISPGWIDSRSDEDIVGEPLPGEDHAQHPCGRVGKPSDVASMILWLADKSNSFVTGQNFVIDGGMTKKMVYR